MTMLVLQAAGSVVGGLASSATATLGRAVSGLFAGSGGQDRIRFSQGPRLTEMAGLTSQDGAPIPRLYGRARLGGQLIWATRFEEIVNTSVTVERASGRRGGKSLGTPKTTNVTTTYAYVANLAIGLCEGPIAFVRRVWADGREVDLTTLTMRVHRGDEAQAPDPLIVAKEGAGNAPAYRGLAYVVFERLPLAPYGNRVPQFSFEIVRPVGPLGEAIRAVCLIPGATEFGYDTAPVVRVLGLGKSAPENTHQFARRSDVEASLDQLEALCPGLRNVSVVASWFGTDLRAGTCRIMPRVDLASKDTSGGSWACAGLTRATADETSRDGGAAAYGGTPSDASVIRLIGELKARGLAVTLYPFCMMDIPGGNALPDPWTGAAAQPAYPWRGRITCDPAPGRPGTVDGTAAAASQVAAMFGTAVPSQFGLAGGAVTYAGPAEWSLRRQALHYAKLAVAAGGVEAFVIGSELVGLTRIRSGPGAYPAVAQLRALAADLRAILGPATKLVYAADWTEYGAHVLQGGQEVRFPLDPLFADPAIDAVGIDFYPPLADWREGADHLDSAISRTGLDTAYLRGRLGAGEAYDWFYADEAARAAQIRSPISDGAYGKAAWTFRAKDLVGWWSNPHVQRVGGVETAATAWQPGSKPIWLTEIGVPAVDKGANGPNAFPDAKSAEGRLPPFSTGLRDDLIQLRTLEAMLSRFDPALAGSEAAMNPASSRYAGRMVDPARSAIWCWDARPYPAFPAFDTVWADGRNWARGHWLNGRLEGAPLGRVVAAILADYGLDPAGAEGLDGFVEGYVIDRPMSARDAIEPLASLFGFDAAAGPSGIVWRGRGGGVDAAIRRDDVVHEGGAPILVRSRAQETDLPGAIELGFTDGEAEYRRATAGSRRLAGTSRRELAIDSALVTRRDDAQRLAEIRLQDIWAGRETLDFALGPRAVALQPGDVVALEGETGLHRIERIDDGAARRVTARAVEPAVFAAPAADRDPVGRRAPATGAGPPVAVLLDLPASGSDPQVLQHLAVAAEPWPGLVAIHRQSAGGEPSLHRLAEVPAVIGRSLAVFGPGPVWRWDRRAVLEVELSGGSLASLSEEAALAGGQLLAVLGPEGAEIVSVRQAELVGPRRYRLTELLRGLGGTEGLATRTLAAGATIVVLDGALVPLGAVAGEIGQSWTYRIGPAQRDLADPAFISLTAPVAATALLPLAPVHAKARREAGGIRIGWIRRTRRDGDGWDLAEVLLAEDREAYEVEILAGSVVKRVVAAGEPSCLYATAEESADFGAAQTQLALRIVQLSPLVGRGRPLAVTLPVL